MGEGELLGAYVSESVNAMSSMFLRCLDTSKYCRGKTEQRHRDEKGASDTEPWNFWYTARTGVLC